MIVRTITRHVYYLLSTLNSLIFGVQSSTLPLQRLSFPLSESTSTLAPTDCLYCIIYWTRRRALSRWIQPKCINISMSAGLIYFYIHMCTQATNMNNCSFLLLCIHLDFTDYHADIELNKWFNDVFHLWPWGNESFQIWKHVWTCM